MLDVGDALVIILKVYSVIGFAAFVLLILSGKFHEMSEAIDYRIKLAEEMQQMDNDDRIIEEVERFHGAPW